MPCARCRIEPTERLSSSRSWLTISTVCGIVGEIVLQPQRALEVEVVGGLVEQQQVGLGEQHGGERHAHAPAAREFRARALLRRLVEAEAGQDARGPRRRRMRADVGEPLVDLGDAAGIVRGLGLGQQARALLVGGEHELDQAVGPARAPPAPPSRCGSSAGMLMAPSSGCKLAGDQAQQRGLARAVAADQADLVAGGDADGGLVEEDAALDADRSGR